MKRRSSRSKTGGFAEFLGNHIDGAVSWAAKAMGGKRRKGKTRTVTSVKVCKKVYLDGAMHPNEKRSAVVRARARALRKCFNQGINHGLSERLAMDRCLKKILGTRHAGGLGSYGDDDRTGYANRSVVTKAQAKQYVACFQRVAPKIGYERAHRSCLSAAMDEDGARSRKRKRKQKKFIQKAIRRPGALRRQLGTRKGETIPMALLQEACKNPRRTLAKITGRIPSHAESRRFQKQACLARTFVQMRGRKRVSATTRRKAA